MLTPHITAVLIVHNEMAMLPQCFECLNWCQEIIVIDNGSVDGSAEYALSRGAKVINFSHSSFARLRNEALKAATGDWIAYIDPDERVIPTLAQEILAEVTQGQASALSMVRRNVLLGSEMKHGGWQTDTVTRIFKKQALQEWTGTIHESPQFEGPVKLLANHLIHLTHRDVAQGIYKSASWTGLEAELLFQATIAPVGSWTVLRKGVMEFVRRVFFKKGFKDGTAGVMEAFIQAINKMLIYIQVWEKQQNPSIAQKYQQWERLVVQEWQKSEAEKKRS